MLAWYWRDRPGALLDANQRRAESLEQAVASLGWEARVTVVRARAEEAGRDVRWRASQSVVVCRSFGAPGVVAECAAPLLRVGGLLVVSEPPLETAAGDLSLGHPGRWPATALAEIGLRPMRFVQEETSYQVLVQAQPCPERLPRRVGIPAKRPLF